MKPRVMRKSGSTKKKVNNTVGKIKAMKLKTKKGTKHAGASRQVLFGGIQLSRGSDASFRKVAAAKGQAGNSTLPKPVVFPDHKKFKDFQPNLTPSQMFRMGSFMDQGGYWRPIYSKPAKKRFQNAHKEFPASWWAGIDEALLVGSGKCDKSANRYGVKCGNRLEDWEGKGWIVPQDPYGWVHWYCRFFQGRRSADDARQIQRWLNLTGSKGRFKRALVNQVQNKKKRFDDETVSPVIRQVLLHWGYQLTAQDCRR